MAAGTLIDSLIVELGLDPSKFNKGQKESIEQFKRTQEEMRRGAREAEANTKKLTELFTTIRNQALGLLTLFTAGKGIKDFIQSTFGLENWVSRLSKTMGMSGGTLNAWQNMVKQVGGSAEGVTSTMKSLTDQIQSFAVTGQSTIVPYLRSLGVQLVDANGKIKTADQLLLDLSKAVEGLDPRRATFVLSQMGIDQDTINLLLEGRKALEAMLEEQKRLGVLTKEDEEAGKAFVKVWSEVEQVSNSVGRSFLTWLAPGILYVLKALRSAGEWFQAHPTVAKAALAGLTVVIVGLTAAIGIGLVGAIYAMSAAFLASPFGWIVAGIAGVTAAGIYLYNKWNDIAAWWKKFWGGAGDDVSKARAKVEGKSGTSVTIPIGPPAKTGRMLGGPYAPHSANETDVDKLMKLGWSREQALGIAANIQRESGGRANASGDNGAAYGLAQWHPDRQRQFARQFGHDIHSATRDEQLAFINWELRHGGKQERRAGTALGAATDAATAARIFSNLYERPKLAEEANIRASMAIAMGGRSPGVAGGDTSISNETNIGTLNVNTAATDAEGIAKDIRPAIERNNFAAQANYGPN